MTEFLVIGFSIIILPFAEHLFILAATKEIFMAKTDDEHLFKESKQSVHEMKMIKKRFKNRGETMEEMLTHRIIALRVQDTFFLFLDKFWGCSCFRSLRKNHSKFSRIFESGKKRLDSELNVIKMINNLRNTRILLKSTLMKEPEIELKIKHDPKNIIDLDVPSDDSHLQRHQSDISHALPSKKESNLTV